MFGKNKDKKEVKEIETFDEKKKIKEEKKNYPYRVYLKDITGSSTKKLLPFGVERWIDENDGTVWLRNSTNNFKEREPVDSDEFKMYEIKELDKNIKILEKKLAKEMKEDTSENIKNIQYELMLYKNFKRSLELQGKGSYMNIDSDGVPYFVFRRKGAFKFPEFDNVELDTIYTPSQTKIKKASELLDIKKEKYSKFQKQLTTASMVFFIINILFGGGLVYWSFALNGMADDSAVQQLQNRVDEAGLYCAELYGQAGVNFVKASEYAVNITESLSEELHAPPIVLEGIQPE